MEELKRCSWVNPKDPDSIQYHDTEWGIPVHSDQKLFEMLILECFQAGLSWSCILHKRETFRRAFDEFDPEIICSYQTDQVEQLLKDPGIVRNRRKIAAAIVNAKVFLAIQREWTSFDRYLWHFTEGKTIVETGKVSSPLSDQVSRDLRKRGMKFVGTVIVYSYLQAVGVINSHEDGCHFQPSTTQ